jgi:hypothetical protein
MSLTLYHGTHASLHDVIVREGLREPRPEAGVWTTPFPLTALHYAIIKAREDDVSNGLLLTLDLPDELVALLNPFDEAGWAAGIPPSQWSKNANPLVMLESIFACPLSIGGLQVLAATVPPACIVSADVLDLAPYRASVSRALCLLHLAPRRALGILRDRFELGWQEIAFLQRADASPEPDARRPLGGQQIDVAS